MTNIDLTPLRQRFLSLLVTETQQVQAFIEVLKEERKVLSEKNVEALLDLSDNKSRHARQLQHLADSRAAIMVRAGLSHDRQGAETLLGGTGLDIWQNYLSIVKQAKQLNQENGLLLTERLAHNHQALAILMAHSDQPAVYGPDGTSHTRPGSRLLGKY